MNVVGYYRRKLGITQAELARRVDRSLVTIKKIETSTLRPSALLRGEIAGVLGITKSLLEQGEQVTIRLLGVGQDRLPTKMLVR